MSENGTRGVRAAPGALMPIGVDFLFSILHSLQSLLFQALGQPRPKEDVLGRSGRRLCSLGCYHWVKQVRDLVGGLVQHPRANIASYAPAGPAAVVRGEFQPSAAAGQGRAGGVNSGGL